MRGRTRRRPAAAAVALPVASLALLGCGATDAGGGEELPVLWEAPEFALLDQTGDTLRSTDLRGAAWVASFIFTNCAGVCPLVTSRMASLRDTLAAAGWLGPRVRLVSFSVDPARDGPGVLREYAARFGASPPSDWAFLTGSPPEAMRKMIQEGFKLTAVLDAAVEDTAADYQVNHSPRLELVDPEGRVRATYDATEPDAVERLLVDLRALVGPREG